jgi:hypothetical protein
MLFFNSEWIENRDPPAHITVFLVELLEMRTVVRPGKLV